MQIDAAAPTLVTLASFAFRASTNSTVQVKIAVVNEVGRGNATAFTIVLPPSASFAASPINATCIRVTLAERIPRDFRVRYVRGGQATLRTVNATNVMSIAICGLEEGFNFVFWVSVLELCHCNGGSLAVWVTCVVVWLTCVNL